MDGRRARLDEEETARETNEARRNAMIDLHPINFGGSLFLFLRNIFVGFPFLLERIVVGKDGADRSKAVFRAKRPVNDRPNKRTRMPNDRLPSRE